MHSIEVILHTLSKVFFLFRAERHLLNERVCKFNSIKKCIVRWYLSTDDSPFKNYVNFARNRFKTRDYKYIYNIIYMKTFLIQNV